MKTKIYVMGGFLLVGSVTGLTACTSIFSDAGKIDVRPILQMADSPSDSTFYQSAVGAMNRRDYALALNYLQAARDKSPGNVQVLNAFGVIYDKLGRFDLSARYYTQANAVEPKSAIVAANMSYSRILQGLLKPQAAPPQLASIDAQPAKSNLQAEATESAPAALTQKPLHVADSQPAPARPILSPPELPAAQVAALNRAKTDSTAPLPSRLPSPRPGQALAAAARHTSAPVIKANLPTSHAIPLIDTPRNTAQLPTLSAISTKEAKKVILTGHPLVIINASSRPSAVDLIRSNLAALGWTLSRSSAVAAHSASYTTLLYPKASLGAARGLARTLPFPLRLTANSCDCGGLALVIGSDFRSWNIKSRKIEMNMHMETSMAALSGLERKGVW
jgi:tetratricopeptide (TPR) repeat protein